MLFKKCHEKLGMLTPSLPASMLALEEKELILVVSVSLRALQLRISL